MKNFRTDRNNNPTAFTTDIAKMADLTLHKDYEEGETFSIGSRAFHTAKLLGDPIEITIKVIDKIGFYTSGNLLRWIYIGIPQPIWLSLSKSLKKDVIHFMYIKEGGILMQGLFN